MKMKRIIVNLAIIFVFAALGWYCYDHGKAYDFIVENVACQDDGQSVEAMEAVQVSIDSGEGKILMPTTATRPSRSAAARTERGSMCSIWTTNRSKGSVGSSPSSCRISGKSPF